MVPLIVALLFMDAAKVSAGQSESCHLNSALQRLVERTSRVSADAHLATTQHYDQWGFALFDLSGMMPSVSYERVVTGAPPYIGGNQQFYHLPSYAGYPLMRIEGVVRSVRTIPDPKLSRELEAIVESATERFRAILPEEKKSRLRIESVELRYSMGLKTDPSEFARPHLDAGPGPRMLILTEGESTRVYPPNSYFPKGSGIKGLAFPENTALVITCRETQGGRATLHASPPFEEKERRVLLVINFKPL